MFCFPSGLKVGDVVENDGVRYVIDFVGNPAGYRYHTEKKEEKKAEETVEEPVVEAPKRTKRVRK